MESYSHLIEYSDDEKMISIYRIDSAGKKELFTQTKFPEENHKIKNFMHVFGENLLLDSPVARKFLKL